MLVKATEKTVGIMLSDTIMALCRNTLSYDSELCIEGLIGITVDKKEILLIHLNETIPQERANIARHKAAKRKGSKDSENDSSSDHESDSGRSNKRKRKRKKGTKKPDSPKGSEMSDNQEINFEPEHDGGEENSRLSTTNQTKSEQILASHHTKTEQSSAIAEAREQQDSEDDILFVKAEQKEYSPSETFDTESGCAMTGPHDLAEIQQEDFHYISNLSQQSLDPQASTSNANFDANETHDNQEPTHNVRTAARKDVGNSSKSGDVSQHREEESEIEIDILDFTEYDVHESDEGSIESSEFTGEESVNEIVYTIPCQTETVSYMQEQHKHVEEKHVEHEQAVEYVDNESVEDNVKGGAASSVVMLQERADGKGQELVPAHHIHVTYHREQQGKADAINSVIISVPDQKSQTEVQPDLTGTQGVRRKDVPMPDSVPDLQQKDNAVNASSSESVPMPDSVVLLETYNHPDNQNSLTDLANAASHRNRAQKQRVPVDETEQAVYYLQDQKDSRNDYRREFEDISEDDCGEPIVIPDDEHRQGDRNTISRDQFVELRKMLNISTPNTSRNSEYPSINTQAVRGSAEYQQQPLLNIQRPRNLVQPGTSLLKKSVVAVVAELKKRYDMTAKNTDDPTKSNPDVSMDSDIPDTLSTCVLGRVTGGPSTSTPNHTSDSLHDEDQDGDTSFSNMFYTELIRRLGRQAQESKKSESKENVHVRMPGNVLEKNNSAQTDEQIRESDLKDKKVVAEILATNLYWEGRRDDNTQHDESADAGRSLSEDVTQNQYSQGVISELNEGEGHDRNLFDDTIVSEMQIPYASQVDIQSGKPKVQRYRIEEMLRDEDEEIVPIPGATKSGRKGDFICHICDKHYSEKMKLKYHLLGHFGKSPYQCEECGKGYVQKCDLKHHVMREHTGEKPFNCEMCGKSFVRKSHLKIHQVHHTGKQAHLCTHCGKGFAQNCDLKYHVMREHTGEMPYTCADCGKGFVTSSGLKMHMAVHKPQRPIRRARIRRPSPAVKVTSYQDEASDAEEVCNSVEEALRKARIQPPAAKVKPQKEKASNNKEKLSGSGEKSIHKPRTRGSIPSANVLYKEEKESNDLVEKALCKARIRESSPSINVVHKVEVEESSDLVEKALRKARILGSSPSTNVVHKVEDPSDLVEKSLRKARTLRPSSSTKKPDAAKAHSDGIHEVTASCSGDNKPYNTRRKSSQLADNGQARGQATYTGDRLYQCDECDRSFARLYLLNQHIKLTHDD